MTIQPERRQEQCSDVPSAHGIDVSIPRGLNTNEGEDKPEQEGQNSLASGKMKTYISIQRDPNNIYVHSNPKLGAHECTRDDQG